MVSANRSGVRAVGARKNGAQHKRRGLLHASRNYRAPGNTCCSIYSVSTSKQKKERERQKDAALRKKKCNEEAENNQYDKIPRHNLISVGGNNNS